MPQSFAALLGHLVFSTKDRMPLIPNHLRDPLHGYLGGFISNCGGALLSSGSVRDHIHLLVSLPRNMAPSALVQEIKVGSSRWIKTQDQRLSDFHWQKSYGVFSISPTHREALERYLANQEEHHRVTTFQDEYRKLLKRYGMEWDEAYVWD